MTDADIFSFNASYTSKLRRVKIPLVVAKESAGQGDALGGGLGAVPPAVEEDRRHLVEATIVRIMKARKSLGHQDLVAETMRQCSHRFTPDAMVSVPRTAVYVD